MPELALQLDQTVDNVFIALDVEHLQILTTEQHTDICCLLAGNGQLMLYLALNVIRHAIAPESLAKLPSRFAFKDLNFIAAHHGVIQVGQHPGFVLIRVLQDRKSTRLNSSHVRISY